LAAAVAAASAEEVLLDAGKTTAQPSWCKTLVSTEDLQRISAAVREVELKTSGEIVPMIVRRSTSVGHVPFILGLVLLTVALLVDVAGVFPEDFTLHGISWAIELVVIFILVRLLSPLYFIERWLTDSDDLARQVEMRAELEFFEHDLQKTSGSTGILIFVSLMERRAVILADKSISEKLPSDIWNQLLKELIESIHQNKFADGMITTIKKIGDLVVPHFPRRQNDVDELSNELVIKE
jgi:putative membrane protein